MVIRLYKTGYKYSEERQVSSMFFIEPVIKRTRNGRYGNNNWFSYSPRLNRIVYLYSDLEYDHWILIENDKNIKAFCEQPLHFNEVVEGELINTIFDMWYLTNKGEHLFIEVKYASELDPLHSNYSLRSVKQIEKQKKWCQVNGYKHEVHTDHYIHKDKLLLKNYKKMMPYIDDRRQKNEMDYLKIKSFLMKAGRSKIETIEDALHEISRHRIRDAIYNMIYEQVLCANLSEVDIGKDLEVWFFE